MKWAITTDAVETKNIKIIQITSYQKIFNEVEKSLEKFIRFNKIDQE